MTDIYVNQYKEVMRKYQNDISRSLREVDDYSSGYNNDKIWVEFIKGGEYFYLPNEYGNTFIYTSPDPYIKKYEKLGTIYKYFNDNVDLSFEEFVSNLEQAFKEGLVYSKGKFNRYSRVYNGSSFGAFFVTNYFLSRLFALSIEKALSSKATDSNKLFFEGKVYNNLEEVFEDKKAISQIKTAKGFKNRVGIDDLIISQPLLSYCLYTKGYSKKNIPMTMVRKAKTDIECRMAEINFYRQIDSYVDISIERQERMYVEIDYINTMKKKENEISLVDVFSNFNETVERIDRVVDESNYYIPYNVFKDIFVGKDYIEPIIIKLLSLGSQLEKRNYRVFKETTFYKLYKEMKRNEIEESINEGLEEELPTTLKNFDSIGNKENKEEEIFSQLDQELEEFKEMLEKKGKKPLEDEELEEEDEYEELEDEEEYEEQTIEKDKASSTTIGRLSRLLSIVRNRNRKR